MAINLISVVPRHERRLRLLFDNAPAAAAFTSTAWYTVANQDSLGASPAVSGAIAVASSPNCVDLALGNDLVGGSLYQLSVAAMPAIDASTCTGSTLFRFGAAPAVPNLEVPVDDFASLLYGRDIVFTGADFGEDASGDLAIIEGLANAQQAIRSRIHSDELPWDASYGVKPRQFVDGTPGSATSLRGIIVSQCNSDDRVQSTVATLSFDPNDPASAYYDTVVTLIGGTTLAPINVKVIG